MFVVAVIQHHNALLYNQLPGLRGEGEGRAAQLPREPGIVSLISEPVCCSSRCSVFVQRNGSDNNSNTQRVIKTPHIVRFSKFLYRYTQQEICSKDR